MDKKKIFHHIVVIVDGKKKIDMEMEEVNLTVVDSEDTTQLNGVFISKSGEELHFDIDMVNRIIEKDKKKYVIKLRDVTIADFDDEEEAKKVILKLFSITSNADIKLHKNLHK